MFVRRQFLFPMILVVSLTVLPAAGFFREPTTIDVQPVVMNTERGLTRVVYFAGQGVAGEFWMDYGRPAWSEKLEVEMEKPENKRWRFGADVWTTYESFQNAKAAGVAVPAGFYYVVLEHPAKDKFNLVLLDQKDLRAKKEDAFNAAKTKGGIVIPLVAGTGEAADRLSIQFKVAEAKPKDATLEIAFGKHRLTAPFVVDV